MSALEDKKMDARFSGTLGLEYDLFAKSIPHHNEMQNLVGNYIHDFCAKDTASGTLVFFEGGAGTGITTSKILNADSRIHIIAVDNEKKTLDQAKALFSHVSERIELKYSDLFDALKDQPDCSLDGFVSAYTIHNFPPEYRAKIFVEIYRSLKSGGIFVNADKYALDDLEQHKRTLDEQINAFGVYDELGRPEVEREWTQHYLEDEKTKISESEQFLILKNLGFKDIARVFRAGMDAIFLAHK
jgi:ubiquinone/menaquinone biosynthesis C-methylase UbiE